MWTDHIFTPSGPTPGGGLRLPEFQVHTRPPAIGEVTGIVVQHFLPASLTPAKRSRGNKPKATDEWLKLPPADRLSREFLCFELNKVNSISLRRWLCIGA